MLQALDVADTSAETGPSAKGAYEDFMESAYDTAPVALSTSSSSATGAAAIFQRYGLDTASEEPEEESSEVGALPSGLGGSKTGAANARRHLSAKERQLMKKGITVAGPAVFDDEPAEPKKAAAEATSAATPPPATAGDTQQQQQQGLKARGKTAKDKKAKAKYHDQDDEDRELAMQVLQPAGQKKDRKQRKAERKERVAARKAGATGLAPQEYTAEEIAAITAKPAGPASRSVSASEGSPSEKDEEGEERQASPGSGVHHTQGEEAAADSGSDGGESTVDDDIDDTNGGPQQEEEAAEVAALLASENMAPLGDDDRDRLTPLDALTGCPKESDTLLYALPVCAPYAVLAGYKHRVKLVPGPLKKGKAAKQAVEVVGREAAGRERDLVRAVPEQEVVNAVVGAVRLQVAGLQKMQKAQRGQKKKK